MNEKDFVRRQKPAWDRLTHLLDASETSKNNLSGTLLREFSKLYRRVARDLAYVRTYSNNQSLERYLNDLLARGHGVLYRHPRRPLVVAFIDATRNASSAVRRRKWFVLTAFVVMLASAIFSGSAVHSDPNLLETVIPTQYQDVLEVWKRRRFGDVEAEGAVAMTGFYLANNTMASLFAAAGGLTFGLLSVYSLYENGVVLGAFTVELWKAGGLGHFATGVLPHGLTELSGIFTAAGAGLMMGWALINPGRRTRSQSVRLVAKDALYMVLLGIAMIWIAAPIEAFISFSASVAPWAKISFAFLSAAVWLSLFTFCGRDLDSADRTQLPRRGRTHTGKR